MKREALAAHWDHEVRRFAHLLGLGHWKIVTVVADCLDGATLAEVERDCDIVVAVVKIRIDATRRSKRTVSKWALHEVVHIMLRALWVPVEEEVCRRLEHLL